MVDPFTSHVDCEAWKRRKRGRDSSARHYAAIVSIRLGRKPRTRRESGIGVRGIVRDRDEAFQNGTDFCLGLYF